MNGSQCNVCGAPATWHDTEYDEYYCDTHAQEYDDGDGALERIAPREEGPYVTKTGKVLSEEDIQRLADEAEEGYDVSRFKQRYRQTAVAPGLESEADVDVWMGSADEMVILGGEEAMLDFELTQPLKPWTVTIEITLSARGQIHAQSLGTEVLDHALAGLDGAAGAVMRVEPNQ